MRIDSAKVGMESAVSRRAYGRNVRRFNLSNGASYMEMQDGAMENSFMSLSHGEDGQVRSNITPFNEWKERYSNVDPAKRIHQRDGNTVNDIRQRSLRYIFNLLFNWRRKRPSESEFNFDKVTQGNEINDPVPFGVGEVISLTDEHTYEFRQSMSFKFDGKVVTKDGKEHSFDISVALSESFTETYAKSINLKAATGCDPLVINIDSYSADVSDQKFYFDLDCDGEKDLISKLGTGSGFLALDKNGDGEINDGSELFGAKSGDGFSDLALYDDDNDGFIDEDDAIWAKLRIMCFDENGKATLYSLRDKNVGAIGLGNIDTEFSIKRSIETTDAIIRKTGIFLTEDGKVGTIQHLDMVK